MDRLFDLMMFYCLWFRNEACGIQKHGTYRRVFLEAFDMVYIVVIRGFRPSH